MSTCTVHGIDNCDTVRRARRWLGDQGIEHGFHDFRRDGLSREQLERWMRHLPWDSVLNRRGTTWRRLDDAARAAVVDQASAIELLLAHPTLVRRPVLESGELLLIGFSEAAWSASLSGKTS